MGCLGNVLWFVFGGAVSGLSWCLAGCLWCITVVGIPVGMQCFKFAALSFFPFGKEVQYGGGAGSFLLNIIWQQEKKESTYHIKAMYLIPFHFHRWWLYPSMIKRKR